MKTSIFILGILWLFYSGMGKAQSFLNGSFENTTGNCDFNISNSTFNDLMNDCHAFGDASQIDIIKNTCGYGSAQSGNYFIGIAVSISLQTDALSLSLDEPLTAGSSYTLSFYSEKSLSYPTNTVEVGYSADSLAFGTSIGTTPLPDESWDLVSFSFTPTVNCRYITVRTVAGTYGWNFVDNFSITPATGIYSGNTSRENMQVSPNPFGACTTVKLDENATLPCELEIYDMHGRLVARKLISGRETRLDKEEIGSGTFLFKSITRTGEIAMTKVISE